MEAKLTAMPARARPPLIASPWHTAIVFGVQMALSVRGYVHSERMRGVMNPDRLSLYERTIFFQWMVFVLVVAGVWLHGTSLYSVLGARWRSLRQLIIDLGVGFLLLMASIMVPAIFRTAFAIRR